jgi:hypothetical protein
MMNAELMARRRKFNSRQLLAGTLAVLIVLGIACRFVGLNWDSGFHLHPDERYLTMTATSLRWPGNLAEYFDSHIAPLNPFNHETNFFVYGQLPLVLVKVVAALSGHDNYDDLVLVGRILSALFDSLTILLVLIIGRKMDKAGEWLAMGGAAFLALTALNIQQAHFFVVDTFAATFLAAAFLSCLYCLDREEFTLWPSMLTGLAWGAAMACKFSCALFAVAVLALFFLLLPAGRSRAFKCGVMIWAFAFLAFRVLNPVAFLGGGGAGTMWGLLDVRPNPQFWNALSEQARISSGQVDVPFNLQWVARAPWLWPLWNLGRWALGWPLLLCCGAGVLLALSRLLRCREVPPSITLAATWTLFIFVFYGGQYSKFTRYYLVATPMAALLASWFILEMRCHPKQSSARIWLSFAGAGALLWTTVWALAVTSLYSRVHPRVAANQWILSNLPPGAVVANETVWDDSLPLWGIENYRALDMKLFEPDDETKREHLIRTLDNTQFIFISSARVWKTVPRLPHRFPLTTAYYRALFDGSLGFKKKADWISSPRFLGWEFPDGDVEESLTVYEHPQVMIFEKTPQYSHDKTSRILSEILLPQPQSSNG